jgi:hypothetical protein
MTRWGDTTENVKVSFRIDPKLRGRVREEARRHRRPVEREFTLLLEEALQRREAERKQLLEIASAAETAGAGQ